MQHFFCFRGIGNQFDGITGAGRFYLQRNVESGDLACAFDDLQN